MANVDDHGLEVLKKAAVNLDPQSKRNYALQVKVINPGDIGGGGGPGGVVTVDQIESPVEVLENIKQKIMNGLDRLDVFEWLDFGTCNQRVDFIEYSAQSISATQSIKKKFNYTQIGSKYKLDSIQWELLT